MPLTAVRSKTAVPFGGKYRIVDFVLSNMLNSGITANYVLVQYRSQSLIEHVRESWTRYLILPRGVVGSAGCPMAGLVRTGTVIGCRRSTRATMPRTERNTRAPSTSSAGGPSSSALREGRAEMDLGGVDVAGAAANRARASRCGASTSTSGRSVGEWLELTGAHERVLDSRRGTDGPRRRPRDAPRWAADERPTSTRSPTSSRPPSRARPAPLGELIDRLAARGRLHGAREATGGRSGPAGARRRRDPGRDGGLPDRPIRGAVRRGAGSPCRRPRVRRRPPRRRGRGSDRRTAIPEVALPQLVVERAPAGARGGGRLVVRRPVARAGRRRDHRHGRQDDDVVPRGRRAPGRRPVRPGLIGTVATRIGGVARRTPAHDDPGRAAAPAAAPGDGRGRQRAGSSRRPLTASPPIASSGSPMTSRS